MSALYTYGTGSSIESVRYSTVDELLNEIPNNNNNLILASDVRDSVFTLWERVSEVSNVANIAASSSSTFQNANPTTVAVGGVAVGTTFSVAKTLQEMFDLIFYPYVGAVPSFSSLSDREYGFSTAVTLNWSVVKNSNTILSIIVDGVSQTPTGLSQTGTKSAVGTHSVTPPISTINTFTMSVYDGQSTPSASVNLTWKNRMFWGTIDLSSLGNPNLTLNPGDASLITAYINSARILALSNNELSTSKTKTITNLNGGGNYLIFAWPSGFSGSTTPTFQVNGLPNSAFTSVKTGWTFTNQYGFSGTNYEVWVSNTIYNGTVSELKIS